MLAFDHIATAQLTNSQKPSRRAFNEDQKSDVRQSAFISRLAAQRSRDDPTDPAGRPLLPPGIDLEDSRARSYLDRLRIPKPDMLTPFREARLPELPELGPRARAYNAAVTAREDESLRRANLPQSAASPRRSMLDRFTDWTGMLRFRKLERGVWLCSPCTERLDTLNPRDEDREELDSLYHKLKIWPPFNRVENVRAAIRKCAVCQQSKYSILHTLTIELQ